MEKQGFTITVQAIFKLFDNYTSKAIDPHILRFILPESFKILSKGDGYFILIGHECKGILSIKSQIYESVTIILEEGNEKTPISLWLAPNCSYAAKFIHFRVEERNIFYCFLNENHALRLHTDYEKGNQNIAIYNEQKINLEGRKVVFLEEDDGYIEDVVEMTEVSENKNKNKNSEDKKEKRSYEIAKIRNYDPSSEEYVLEQPMSRSYKKIKTKVAILYYATSNNEGICWIALPEISSYVVIDQKGKVVKQSANGKSVIV